MFSHFKNIAIVSFSTVGSRVLGLVRDILIFASLGAGLWNSAFVLAFTLPNLFRRLLGEGALTSAMVPVFSDVLERSGKVAAFRFFNGVLWRLCVVLFVLILGGITLLALVSYSGVLPERWQAGAHLSIVLLPYMWFICLAAIISAGLNLLGKFALPSLTPVLLNLSMIGALMAGLFMTDEAAILVRWLCGGVLVGGLLQLLLPAWDFARSGWRPQRIAERLPEMEELWRLFLPGLMGAAILQINILVSRLLAFYLNESAAALLYLSSRLMELPLGIFTIAVTTVFFPLLAKSQAARDEAGFSSAICSGMRLVVGISLPAGVGLCVLGAPILELLFEWGAFSASDVVATLPLIAIYGLGLPFYSAATFTTRGLHASKDMKSPVKIAAWCLIINAVLGVTLMYPLGASGLALANVLAACAQAFMLWSVLSKANTKILSSKLFQAFVKVITGSVLMGLYCYAGRVAVESFDLTGKWEPFAIVVLLIPTAAGLYLFLLALMRFEELATLRGMVRKFLPKKPTIS
jgi:putative peptidoglycan lipid II flippase